tara:strand:- start:394 stop:627 length:234 start_codon:yes stop_codon:yes gene_type:complete
MKIIFKNSSGCSVITPAPKFLASLPSSWSEEKKLIFVANKDLPAGTKYEITDEVPSDRTFRNAWEYVAGPNERTTGE